MTALHDLSIAAAGRKLREGQVTSEQLTRHALDRIARLEPSLHAFITLTGSAALDAARAADAALAAGADHGPLHGIPYALKDIYDTAGLRTTCHSRLREHVVPQTDSVVAARLKAGGGVLLGKLATHEFALGGPSFDLPFPPARNPWNPDHVTGGSSSGSGAAVAAGMVRMAMGSDTGGSIRGPAAYCGTVGLKPTYGRVSRRGVFPLSYTLDHCGPLTRTVEDAAITLQVIAGHDPLDAASARVAVPDFSAALDAGVAGLRIGIPRVLFAHAQAITPEVLAEIDRIAGLLRDAGAMVEDVVLPDYALFAACGRVIMSAESFAIHAADLRERPLDFGRIAMERFVLGAAITAADLVEALRLRRELTEAVNAALQPCDALLTASALGTAPRFDEPPSTLSAALPMQSIPFNVSGHPALGVPTGPSQGGLPIGVQLVGRPFDEATVLRIGRTVERLSGWEAVALPG